jgi:glyoxylase-like metal-dependent hydrolase (beta-lactamase superfamily II)/rhodanese-related sulfurtransferase
MLFRQLLDTTSNTFTYLIADEGTCDALLIDPVFERHARDAALLRELGLKLRFTVDTHLHADHVTGAWLMKDAFGSQIAVSRRSGAAGADIELGEGDRLTVGRSVLEVRETPGHTSGCITLVTQDRSMAFTGDCLLIRGCGRTDFQEGDARQLYHSITEKIFDLPDDCLVYPAHDYQGRAQSSVGEEKQHNPRVGGRADEGDFVGYMQNLGLPQPAQIDVALPANRRLGRPESDGARARAEWGPVTETYAGILEIDSEWVSGHLDELCVLDVRDRHEVADRELGCIPGSLNIPLSELRDRIAEVPTERPVVAVCRSGRRSAQATVILRKSGLTDVANLAGGMLRWREAAVQGA